MSRTLPRRMGKLGCESVWNVAENGGKLSASGYGELEGCRLMLNDVIRDIGLSSENTMPTWNPTLRDPAPRALRSRVSELILLRQAERDERSCGDVDPGYAAARSVAR